MIKIKLLIVFFMFFLIFVISSCTPAEKVESAEESVEVQEAEETEAPIPTKEEVVAEPESKEKLSTSTEEKATAEPKEKLPIDSLFPDDILPKNVEISITALETEKPCFKLSTKDKIVFTEPELVNKQQTSTYKEKNPHYKGQYGNYMESENCDGTYQSVKFLVITADIILRKYNKEEDVDGKLLEIAESKKVKSPTTFKGLPALESSESTDIQKRTKLLWNEKQWIIHIDVSTYFFGLDPEAISAVNLDSKVLEVRDKFAESIYQSLH